MRLASPWWPQPPRWRRAPAGPLAAVALGGNRGDTLAVFRTALAALAAAGLPPLAVSSAYRTTAAQLSGVGVAPAYFNAVMLVRPQLPLARAWALLAATQAAAGPRSGFRWAARALDLDILAWGPRCCRQPLQVPHPRLAERGFVLWPLCEVAANWVLPGLQKTPLALLAQLAQQGAAATGMLAVRRRWW